jgi:hypothetical protein
MMAMPLTQVLVLLWTTIVSPAAFPVFGMMMLLAAVLLGQLPD